MKKALKTLWAGLTGIVSALFNGICTLFGLKEETMYAKVLRRIIGTCFAAIVAIYLVNITVNSIRHYRFLHRYEHSDYISYENNTEVSPNISFHEDEYYSQGYIFTSDGRRTIENVAWISKPMGDDSLVCYSIGDRRGYFNMNTGLVAIEPIYNHAWVFSDGLAAVDDKGWVKFIDQNGQVVIDNRTPYELGFQGYVFHAGLCAVNGTTEGTVGLIDKNGKWIVDPIHTSITATDTFWIIGKGEQQCVLSQRLDTVIPYIDGTIILDEGLFVASMNNHSLRTYSIDGRIVEPFLISNVEQMIYDTDIMRSSKSADEYDEYVVYEQEQERAVAHCLKYEADYGWYGLMSPDGRIVTPPSYYSITPIGHDLYLCEYSYNQGIILNGRGQRVK